MTSTLRTVVFDNGGGKIKAGYAGDADPLVYVHSSVVPAPAKVLILLRLTQIDAQCGSKDQATAKSASGKRNRLQNQGSFAGKFRALKVGIESVFIVYTCCSSNTFDQLTEV